MFQTLRSLRSEFDLGNIEPEKPISLGTYKGYKFTIRFSNRTFVQRMLHGHGRDFTVRVSAPRFEAIAGDAERFFNSFRPEGMDREEKIPVVKKTNQERPTILMGARSDILFVTFDRDGKRPSGMYPAACEKPSSPTSANAGQSGPFHFHRKAPFSRPARATRLVSGT